ncbi:hypothetical protein DOTSEDRAFT_77028 [Dothistroma septosporum NZE10]|uniref:BZIP domain-containing protein n=1 Tax=Dothistroma septosporum (strain NZE10 / CBS 128990) TaxID=675120 RepID=N1Q269_DOTSN|nr:hypothetical protein DOTSEDRAFT_77028 [Dothistroma septosporum NZE10]
MSARTAGRARNNGTAGDKEKPWASGRVLTAEQRARKQEADRKANRFLKKEVQDRLALLEARVLELEARPSTTNGAGSSNVDRPADAFAPNVVNSGPEDGVQGPGRIIESYARDPSNAQAALPEGSVHSHGESYFQNGSTAPASQVFSAANSMMPEDTNEDSQHAVQPDFSDVSTTARTRPDGRHMTCFLNNLVNYIRHLAPNSVCFDDQYNQDLIVSAVIKGWEATLSRYHQKCPLWDVLRLVDMYLFKDCNMVERISILRMLHKRYLFEVNANLPTAGPPPPWFRPQFSEKVFFHDPVIDHLTWPRLRDRLVQSEKDRLTNRFWSIYIKNIRVTWRHEPFEIMTFDGDRQLYRLSPAYETALLDMNNWKMEMDFFRGIPQLAGDVPPFNYMPLRRIEPNFGAIEDRRPSHASITPRFGIQEDLQGQQQPGALTGEEEWISGIPPGGVQEMPVHNGQLHMPKMAPNGVWQDFYT